jgi:hypothetical protein
MLTVMFTVEGVGGLSFAAGIMGGHWIGGTPTSTQRRAFFAFLNSPPELLPVYGSPQVYDLGQSTPYNYFIGQPTVIWRKSGAVEFHAYGESDEPTLTLDLGGPMEAGSYTVGFSIWGSGEADLLPYMSPTVTNFTIQELEVEGPEEPGPSFWTGYVNCTES